MRGTVSPVGGVTPDRYPYLGHRTAAEWSPAEVEAARHPLSESTKIDLDRILAPLPPVARATVRLASEMPAPARHPLAAPVILRGQFGPLPRLDDEQPAPAPRDPHTIDGNAGDWNDGHQPYPPALSSREKIGIVGLAAVIVILFSGAWASVPAFLRWIAAL